MTLINNLMKKLYKNSKPSGSIKLKSLICAATLASLSALLISGCSGTDVVLKYSPGSINNIIGAYPSLVTDSTATDHYYRLSVDNNTTLLVSNDYKATGSGDILIETPLKPFTDAGLEVSKLVDGYNVKGDMFYLTADYGDGTGTKASFSDSLFDSVISDRTMLTYHQKLDHYGIKLLKGKFEYAKDYKTNSKDIVFVIKAQPLADLGVNVNNIDGWTFTTVQDNDGTEVEVLLKAYDLDAK
ncbi:MAG: hypothetical protein HGA22_02675 [Clostridiales bacterium]|nr:hypothetical protein [Clostridiales bacterium]